MFGRKEPAKVKKEPAIKHKLTGEILLDKTKDGKNRVYWMTCICGARALVIEGYGFCQKVVIQTPHLSGNHTFNTYRP